MKFLIFWKLRVMHDIMITPVLWQLNCVCVCINCHMYMYFKFLKYRLFLIHCACNTEVGMHSLSPSYVLVTSLKRDCMYDQLWFHVRWLYQLVLSWWFYNNFMMTAYIYVYIYLQSDYTFRIKIKFQDTVQSEHPCKS